MKMEVYTIKEIIHAINLLETAQDGLEVADHDELYDMLQEVIEILYYEGDEE
jgi:hypothetical protein